MTQQLGGATASVTDRVLGLLAAQTGVSTDIPTDVDLTEVISGFDSVAAMDLVVRVEAEFGIEVDFVSDDIRHHFATVQRIARFVQLKMEDLPG